MLTNKEKILKLCKEISEKEPGSIFSLGNKNSALRMPRWSTGLEDLDAILGGGMPEGRIIEVFGPESSGKTSLGYHLAACCEQSLYIPIEGTFDGERAKVFGCRSKSMIVYRARYGEQAMNKADQFAQAGIPIIIIDSIPACKPKEDIDKIRQAIKRNEEVNERMGGVARLMHKYLPLLEETIETTGTTIILVNQVRDKMDAVMFGEKTDTPGGRAPKHYSSIRIQVARRAWIEIPAGSKSVAKTDKVGIIMKAKCVKNKTANPMGEAEIPMFFDRGFVGYGEIPEIRRELMKASKQKGGRQDDEQDDDE
jgi:recombination protein RecA